MPLTPFVGRAAERAALAAALAGHRLVTAVGPGGIGKTRLALAVAAEVAGRFADGVWYVDLVPVTDNAMVAPALAAALGLGEQQGRSAEETVLGWLGDREALLVLDNCEHLVDGVVVLVERLLAACPRVRVLATSRARLLVPYERVFPVPGMTVSGDGGDAVELFLDRAAAAGGPAATVDRHRVAGICRGLDGVALAIELAAARLPALGLDGLEAGLADRLRLLAGGRRLDDRHRSLRSALDWSHALLAEARAGGAAPGRRSSPPRSPRRRPRRCSPAGRPPRPRRSPPALAALAEHSLLVAVAAADGTRYRALETIRQYGAERLAEAGELARGARPAPALVPGGGGGAGRGAGTRIGPRAGGVRPARRRAARRAGLGGDRARSARPTGTGWRSASPELCFARGLPGEAQRRYEQAAALAADDQRGGLGAALCRLGGGGPALRRRGDPAAPRVRRRRAPGRRPAARRLRPGADRRADQPRPRPDVEAAAAGRGGAADRRGVRARRRRSGRDGAGGHRRGVPATRAGPGEPPQLIERGIALARQAGDPLAESAALDLLTSIQLARGEIQAAAASALRRTRVARRRCATGPTPAGSSCSTPTRWPPRRRSRPVTWRRRGGFAEEIRDLPFYREEGHLATARLLVVTALAGDWDETAAFGERFRDGWERAGRPRAGNLNRGAYAAAAVCGLRGDEAGRAEWLTVVDELVTPACRCRTSTTASSSTRWCCCTAAGRRRR